VYRPEWSSMKTLLGDASMVKRLLDVDKNNINDVVMRKLKKYLEMPTFSPDEVNNC
jgi:dynein heavy chain